MENAITMPENTRLAWQIVLMHGVPLFNHAMIDSLVVSKNHDAILLSTAECRKQFFMQKYRYLKEVEGLEWNIYGTACAKVQWDKKLSCALYPIPRGTCYHQSKTLMLERRYLLDYDHGRFGKFSNFYGCLPHRPRVFFGPSRCTSFYGYGGVGIDDDEKSGGVVMYCMSSVMAQFYQCFTCINKQQIPLMNFLEFPALLKAFLNSTVIMRGHRSCDKIYALEGVEIPKKFLQWKQYFSTPQYNSFKDLPRFIRKAIVERYNEQKIERRKLIC